MELNREQIIKALECCTKVEGFRDIEICRNCPLKDTQCAILLPKNALSLIKELTEENEGLRDKLDRTEKALITVDKAHNDLFTDTFRIEAEAKADTVRKMQELIKERCIKGGIFPAFVARTIDQIAIELLEEIK